MCILYHLLNLYAYSFKCFGINIVYFNIKYTYKHYNCRDTSINENIFKIRPVFWPTSPQDDPSANHVTVIIGLHVLCHRILNLCISNYPFSVLLMIQHYEFSLIDPYFYTCIYKRWTRCLSLLASLFSFWSREKKELAMHKLYK